MCTYLFPENYQVSVILEFTDNRVLHKLSLVGQQALSNWLQRLPTSWQAGSLKRFESSGNIYLFKTVQLAHTSGVKKPAFFFWKYTCPWHKPEPETTVSSTINKGFGISIIFIGSLAICFGQNIQKFQINLIHLPVSDSKLKLWDRD